MFVNLLENVSLTLALTLTAVVVTIIYLSTKLKVYYSPGPWGFPVLGYYPFLRSDCHVQLADMVKKYGDAYLLNVCGKVLLHIGSHKALKEAHVNKADYFAGRYVGFSMINVVLESGVVMSNDESWRVQRKFVVQNMRELGLGTKLHILKNPLEDSIKHVLDILKNSNGHPVKLSNVMSENCADISTTVLLGNNISKKSVKEFNQAFMAAFDPLIGPNSLLLGEIAKFFVVPFIKSFKNIFDGTRQMKSILYEVLADHKANFDPDHPGDLIDLYLRERKMLQEKGDPKAKYFTDESLIATLIQLHGDAGESIGAVLGDYFRQLASHIDVQNAIYDEIAREIGTSRLPNHEDRNKLPYTNAVIKELERMSPFFPLLLSLECNRDTTVSGVFVPKGAITLVNFHAIHNNPSIYKNPEVFDPNRFLPDAQGSRLREEMPVKFGVGKRACAGESLVMLEVFVFLTSIMQHFSLHFEEEKDQTGHWMTLQDANELRFRAVPR